MIWRKSDGDAAEAEAVWRALGGGGDFREPEAFATRFVPISDVRRRAGVTDRGYEYSQRSRSASAVEWSVEAPDSLRSGSTLLVVVRRELEPFQSEPPYGFGFTETIRIEEGAKRGGRPSTVRAARLNRRLTPADDGSIAATELVASFRSVEELEAGALPTSTTESLLMLTRMARARGDAT